MMDITNKQTNRHEPLFKPDSDETPVAGEAEISPCKRLLESILMQALCDAHGRDERAQADSRMWFSSFSICPGGWGWVSQWLQISRVNRKRFERYARNPAYAGRRNLKRHLTSIAGRSLVLAIWLLFVTPAHAATSGYVCMSAFAWLAPHFPRAEWIAMHREIKRPCLPVLLGTFGDDTTRLGEFTRAFADRPHLVHVELSNETARRHEVWGPGEILPGFPPSALNTALAERWPIAWEPFQDRLMNLAAVIRAVSNKRTRWVVTLGLESNYSPQAVSALVALSRSILPEGIALANYERLAGTDFREVHGRKVCNNRRCIVNEDGAPADLAASRRFLRDNKNAYLRELWSGTLQGRRPRVAVGREVAARLRLFAIAPAVAAKYARLLKQAE